MKKIEEMSNQELQQKIDLMKDVDSPEAKTLLEQFRSELNRREAEAEAKRKAEEAKRKAEAEKKAAEAEKEEEKFVEKQKAVIGKYYKKVFYDTNYLKPTVHYTVYYKVTGICDDKVVVTFVKKYEYSDMISKAVTFINLNDLFDKNEHYEEITRKEFNDVYEKSINSFGTLSEIFNRIFKDSVFF